MSSTSRSHRIVVCATALNWISSIPIMIHRFLIALLLTVSVLWVSTLASPILDRRDKASQLSAWSQPTTDSYNSWANAHDHQSSAPEFNWQTDYCSKSPDQPFGYDFRMPCWRHDFNYRNYKAIGQFTPENKARIDKSFYEDMKRVCGSSATCKATAWTYYQAVVAAGLQANAAQYQCFLYDKNGPPLK
ncbi:phospholipase A2 [Spizellomyces sp. 'palustris']|nr:phospholipase A2 [Spizellomyces sp. 'palustris']